MLALTLIQAACPQRARLYFPQVARFIHFHEVHRNASSGFMDQSLTMKICLALGYYRVQFASSGKGGNLLGQQALPALPSPLPPLMSRSNTHL